MFDSPSTKKPFGLNAVFKVFLILGMLTLAACDGAEEREAAYFERGKALFEEGKFTKASLEFKNARQINPLNMEALYYLGLIAEGSKDYRAALAAFRKVSEQNTKHVGANIHAGRILLAAGQIDEALLRAERVLEAEPDSADGRALRGAVYLRRNRLSDARTEAEAALKKDGVNAGAISVLVGIYQKENRNKEAIELLEKSVAGSPSASALRLLLIEMYRRTKNIDAIKSVYADLFKLDPKNHGHRIDLAKLLIGFDKKADAEQVLRDGVAEDPTNNRPKLILIDFLANQRSLGDAERTLKDLIDKSPENNMLRFGLAQLYAKHKKSGEAEQVLRNIADTSESNPEVIRAKTALARLRLVAGDVPKAEALVEEVLSTDKSNGDALTTRGQIHLQKNQLNEAIADLRRVLRDNPDSAQALALVADAHLRADEIDLAAQSLRQLLTVSPTNDAARLRLARLYVQQRNYDTALALTDQALSRKPSSEEALRLRSDILIAQRKLGPALATAEKLRDVADDKPQGHISVARVHQAEGRHVEALAAFDKALSLEPTSTAALTGIIRSHLLMKQVDEAVARLKAVIKKAPDNVYAHNLLGEVYATDKAVENAKKAFTRATELRDTWTLPYVNLSRLILAQDKPKEAIVVLQKGLKASPKDATLLFTLATAQQAAKDYDAAIATYSAMLAENPKMDVAANNMAALVADHRYEDAEALEKALAVAQRFQTSENPFYLDTLGWLLYRKGDYSLAVVTLKRAVDELPDHPYLNFHLGMAYYKSGQTEQAKPHLEKAVAQVERYPEIAEAKTILESL